MTAGLSAKLALLLKIFAMDGSLTYSISNLENLGVAGAHKWLNGGYWKQQL